MTRPDSPARPRLAVMAAPAAAWLPIALVTGALLGGGGPPAPEAVAAAIPWMLLAVQLVIAAVVVRLAARVPTFRASLCSARVAPPRASRAGAAR